MLLSWFMLAAPVLAVCSITGGACSVGAPSNWESPTLQEKVMPNNLKEMGKTNAFQPNYFKPYHNELINTKENPTPIQEYNSNCQFGVCLPGVEPGHGRYCRIKNKKAGRVTRFFCAYSAIASVLEILIFCLFF